MALGTDPMTLMMILTDTIADTNRTLEQNSPHPYKYKVHAIVVDELRYDEDKDELVETGEQAAMTGDGQWL